MTGEYKGLKPTEEVMTGPITVEYRPPYAVIILPDGTELLKVHPVAGTRIAQGFMQAYTEWKDTTK